MANTKYLAYRMKLRKELGKLDRELLDITYEETKKMIEYRNSKKGRK